MNWYTYLYCGLSALVSYAHADTVDSYHACLLGNYYLAEGKTAQAQQYFAETLATSCSPYAYEGYFHCLYQNQQYRTLLTLLEQTEPFFKTNPTVQLLYARALRQVGKPKQIAPFFENLAKQFPYHEEIAYEIALYHLNNSNHPQALQVLTTVLNHNAHSSKHFMLYFLQSILYYHLNQPQRALVAIYKSLEQHPQFDRGIWWLQALQAHLHKQQAIEAALQPSPHNISMTKL